MRKVLVARRTFAALLGGWVVPSASAQTRPSPISLLVVGAGEMNLGPQGLLQGLEEHGLVRSRDYTIRFLADAVPADLELKIGRAHV